MSYATVYFIKLRRRTRSITSQKHVANAGGANLVRQKEITHRDESAVARQTTTIIVRLSKNNMAVAKQ